MAIDASEIYHLGSCFGLGKAIDMVGSGTRIGEPFVARISSIS